MSLTADKTWVCIERRTDGAVNRLRVSNVPGGPDHCYFTGVPPHLPDCGERLLIDPTHLIPMYRQGGLSGAWYPEVDGDEPNGWLVIPGVSDDGS